ncbi:kinesin light chain [Fusarium longipes]|uniref:Kinesin light chain n=1 Tax=Fusarium longipes TaxID=694270 RepID=A0A395SY12_9HYPO|nr:kinesin light chain [Fusarium longipes]
MDTDLRYTMRCIPKAFGPHVILAKETKSASTSDDDLCLWDDTDKTEYSSEDNNGDEQSPDNRQGNTGHDRQNPNHVFLTLSSKSHLVRKLEDQPESGCFNSVPRPGLWANDPNLDLGNRSEGFPTQLANVCSQASINECANEQCLELKTSMEQLAPFCSWKSFREWAITAMSCQTVVADDTNVTGAHTHIARAVSVCFAVLKYHLDNRLALESDDFDQIETFEIINLIYWMTRIQTDLGTPPANLSRWDHHFIPFQYTIKPVQKAINDIESMRICKNRLWNVINASDRKHGDLPDIVTSLLSIGESLAHKGHESCTPSKCQSTHMDSTKVEQLHKCDSGHCGQKTFPVELLATEIKVGESTAWLCDKTKQPKASPIAPQLNVINESYIAISHVWSDGTGVVKDAGSVNRCLYEFFEQIAIRLGCKALWWDAISIPQELKARSKAMQTMHSNYANAEYIVVHDNYLVNFPWSDDGSPCLALVLSTWFTRGWIALELAMAQKVKVLFKDPDTTKTEPIIKDLDKDILAHSPHLSTRAHWIATCLVQRLRRPVKDIGDLLAALGPRSTSWARDRTIIASLLAGVPDVDFSVGESVITRRILKHIGRIHYQCLLHGKPTMSDSGGYSWSPATLYDMPIEVAGGIQRFGDHTAEGCFEIDDNGSLWGICAFRALREEDVRNGNIKAYGDNLAATIKVNLALSSWKTCALVRPSTNNKDPRCLLVVLIGILQDSPIVKCRYIGTVVENNIYGYDVKRKIVIGGQDSSKVHGSDAAIVLNKSHDEFTCFNPEISRLFEQDLLLNQVNPTTVNNNFNTSSYTSSNILSSNESNDFCHLLNDQFFGSQTPPLVYPSDIQQDMFPLEKTGEQRNVCEIQLFETQPDNKHLAQVLSRKKAQNRAAQIAFRKKKEKYLKELEEKVASIETAQKKISAENELLTEALEKLRFENEILLACTNACNLPSSKLTAISADTKEKCPGTSAMPRVGGLTNGRRLITVGEAWDLITSHHLFIEGRLDLTDILRQLKDSRHYDEYFTFVSEHVVTGIIDRSASKSTDYLF